jgi:hypothetical protein
MAKLPAAKFTTEWAEQGIIENSGWNLTYEQPGSTNLVTTVAEFLTYCTQYRKGENPDDVLKELSVNGTLAAAPMSLLDELVHGGYARMEGVKFAVIDG